MQDYTLSPKTTVPGLTLRVSDLDAELEFYQNALGLELVSRSGDKATLGAGGSSFLTLVGGALRPRNPRETGLYHYAILVPTRLALARTLSHLVQSGAPLGGFADHLVSEAIYLSDPEQNGIEIYRDRPREEWTRSTTGEIEMATDPLDIKSLGDELAANPAPWQGIDPETRLGHIHLQVANLRDTETFYVGVLGFDVTTQNYPGALFFSAGGYHHHIGTNTWNSLGALPPAPDSAGLVNYEIRLPDASELGKVVDRLHEPGIETQEREEGIEAHDPSQNEIVLTTM